MSEDMKSLLEAEEEAIQEIKEHDVVKATVVAVEDGQAYVNIAGLKSDIPITKRELATPEPESAKDVVKVNDESDDIYLEPIENQKEYDEIAEIFEDRLQDLYFIKDDDKNKS